MLFISDSNSNDSYLTALSLHKSVDSGFIHYKRCPLLFCFSYPLPVILPPILHICSQEIYCRKLLGTFYRMSIHSEKRISLRVPCKRQVPRAQKASVSKALYHNQMALVSNGKSSIKCVEITVYNFFLLCRPLSMSCCIIGGSM